MKALGLDLGDRRIGVAVSDPSCKLALGRETLFVSDEKDAIRKIKELVRANEIDTVVVGLPLNMNGSSGPRAEKTREFAELIERKMAVAIEFWDERLTTSIAKRVLHDAGRKATKRDGRLDQMSAILILQGYLDRRATASETRIET